MYSDSLIDRALKICEGSAAELGRRIGVSRVTVHNLKTRKMKLSVETAALLAAVVHDDPHYAMETVAIEMAEPGLAARLTAAFHRTARASGAVETLLISDEPPERTGINHVKRKLTVYTLSWMFSTLRDAIGAIHRPVLMATHSSA